MHLDHLVTYGSGVTAVAPNLSSLIVDGFHLPNLQDVQMRSGNGRVTDPCSTPDATKYHDPSSQRSSIDGMPLTYKMPPARHGLVGSVVPRATYFGGSQGSGAGQPSGPRLVNVVDFYDPKLSVEVDLAKITPALSARAIDIVRKAAGPPTDIEQFRARQAATFCVYEQMTKGASTVQFGQPAQPSHAPQEIQPPPQYAPPQYVPPGVPPGEFATPPPYYQTTPPYQQATPIDRPGFYAAPSGNLMSAFSPQPNPATFAQRPSQNGAVPPPQHKVIFGNSLGNQDALYHTVIHQPGDDGKLGVLLFGIDLNYQGPQFRPKLDSPENLAVHIAGTDKVYLIESMGIQFEHRGELLTQWMIVDEKAAS